MSKTKANKAPGVTGEASLSAVDVFQGLPASSLRALEKGSRVSMFPGGHLLFQPGQRGHELFLLEKGRVETFRASRNRRLIIAELKPPAIFGEMGCIGQGIYHCFAQTTEPSRIRIISRSQLETLLQQHPVVTRRLLDLVSRRFVHVLLDLDATSFRHLIPRLANLLIERADGDYVRNITHKEIAERLRVYRESATAALGELRKAGIIAIGRKQIRILDRGRLERAARE